MILKDKIAVVTGGSRGIGRAIAEIFAENGASVAVLGTGESILSASAEIREKSGADVRGYICDVTDAAAVKSVFSRITAEFGSVDILVNNAGITRDRLMMSMKPEDFDAVLSVNLRGAFLCTKEVYPIFAKKRGGRILNISSVSGITGNAGQTNYSASKAGMIGMTKAIARELAPRGVTCNAIAPGFVETDMTAAFAENTVLRDSIPLKRFANPEEIAALALFLASDAAGYITGEVIRIDGGMAM